MRQTFSHSSALIKPHNCISTRRKASLDVDIEISSRSGVFAATWTVVRLGWDHSNETCAVRHEHQFVVFDRLNWRPASRTSSVHRYQRTRFACLPRRILLNELVRMLDDDRIVSLENTRFIVHIETRVGSKRSYRLRMQQIWQVVVGSKPDWCLVFEWNLQWVLCVRGVMEEYSDEDASTVATSVAETRRPCWTKQRRKQPSVSKKKESMLWNARNCPDLIRAFRCAQIPARRYLVFQLFGKPSFQLIDSAIVLSEE